MIEKLVQGTIEFVPGTAFSIAIGPRGRLAMSGKNGVPGTNSIEACRLLFREYEKSIGVSLCFQGFAQELATLPAAYARPRGRLILARITGEPAGCVALRPLGDGDGEMKRLYVRPAYRGMGLGRMLAECAIDEARALGYASLKLDTLPQMKEAQAMYAALGFVDIAPYNDHPIEGTRFLSLALR